MPCTCLTSGLSDPWPLPPQGPPVHALCGDVLLPDLVRSCGGAWEGPLVPGLLLSLPVAADGQYRGPICSAVNTGDSPFNVGCYEYICMVMLLSFWLMKGVQLDTNTTCIWIYIYIYNIIYNLIIYILYIYTIYIYLYIFNVIVIQYINIYIYYIYIIYIYIYVCAETTTFCTTNVIKYCFLPIIVPTNWWNNMYAQTNHNFLHNECSQIYIFCRIENQHPTRKCERGDSQMHWPHAVFYTHTSTPQGLTVFPCGFTVLPRALLLFHHVHQWPADGKRLGHRLP